MVCLLTVQLWSSSCAGGPPGSVGSPPDGAVGPPGGGDEPPHGAGGPLGSGDDPSWERWCSSRKRWWPPGGSGRPPSGAGGPPGVIFEQVKKIEVLFKIKHKYPRKFYKIDQKG